MNTEKTPTVTCFGEILWDVFPNALKIGGAPLNVAYNLKRLGINSQMISKVGNDEPGLKMIAQLKQWDMPVHLIQRDMTYPTGTVIATFDEHKEAHYEIIKPVAWDFIEWVDEYEALIKTTDAFVFGSLGARHKLSRSTLYTALEIATVKVFDVNFRPPFYSLSLIKELLYKATIVKLNKAELRQLISWIGKEFESEAVSVRIIQELFTIDEVLLTKGSQGASYFNTKTHYDFDAIPVVIKDTVGSGDSFLAGFLSEKIQGKDPVLAMENAIALGAFITSKEGGCPAYDKKEFELFNSRL